MVLQGLTEAVKELVELRLATEVPDVYAAMCRLYNVDPSQWPEKKTDDMGKISWDPANIPEGLVIATIRYKPKGPNIMPAEWILETRSQATWEYQNQMIEKYKGYESIDELNKIVKQLGPREMMFLHDAVASTHKDNQLLYRETRTRMPEYYDRGDAMNWPHLNGAPAYNKALDSEMWGKIVANRFTVHVPLLMSDIDPQDINVLGRTYEEGRGVAKVQFLNRKVSPCPGAVRKFIDITNKEMAAAAGSSKTRFGFKISHEVERRL